MQEILVGGGEAGVMNISKLQLECPKLKGCMGDVSYMGG